MDLQGPPRARCLIPDVLSRLSRSKVSSENIYDVFPDCNDTYRGVDGPTLDDIIFTKIRANKGTTAASENVAEAESATSTLTCVEYTPKEVEETSLLHEASQPSIR